MQVFSPAQPYTHNSPYESLRVSGLLSDQCVCADQTIHMIFGAEQISICTKLVVLVKYCDQLERLQAILLNVYPTTSYLPLSPSLSFSYSCGRRLKILLPSRWLRNLTTSERPSHPSP